MCIFPTGESREGKKLKTSQAEFTTHHPPCLADEPYIGLSATRESLEVMWTPYTLSYDPVCFYIMH